MQNKVYFTETKPGVYKRDSQFKLKTDFVAFKQYKEIDAFGWKILERINSLIEGMVKENSSQNLSNKQKNCANKFDQAKKRQNSY